jgi:hypothetical protein
MNKTIYAFIPKVGKHKTELDYYKGDPVFVEMTELTESIIQTKTKEWNKTFNPETSTRFGVYNTTTFKRGDIVNIKERMPQDWKIFAFSVNRYTGTINVHLELVADPSQEETKDSIELILVR